MKLQMKINKLQKKNSLLIHGELYQRTSEQDVLKQRSS